MTLYLFVSGKKSVYSPPSTYSCHLCDAVLSTQFYFRLHLAEHGGFKYLTQVLNPHGMCLECGYFATSRSDLAQHTGGHNFERRFFCTLCPDYDDHNTNGVATHIRKFHGEGRKAEIGDRVKLRKSVNRNPKAVSIDPKVCLSDFFRQSAEDLNATCISHGIKHLDATNIQLTSDKFSCDRYKDTFNVIKY